MYQHEIKSEETDLGHEFHYYKICVVYLFLYRQYNKNVHNWAFLNN